MDVEGESVAKRWQERVIHQIDIYYEEESSANAVLSIHNTAMIVLYTNPEEEDKEGKIATYHE